MKLLEYKPTPPPEQKINVSRLLEVVRRNLKDPPGRLTFKGPTSIEVVLQISRPTERS